jgi:hypothetical protein
MVGNFGAFASANLFPYVQSLTGSAAAHFALAAALDLAGVWCWFYMRGQPDPGRQLTKSG